MASEEDTGDTVINPCEESFTSIANDEEKRFLCPTCGNTFTRKFSLQRHIKMHENAQIHKCKDCSRTYSCKYDLENHARGKHGTEKMKCDTCHKVFSFKQSLLVHAKRCGKSVDQSEEQGTKCTHCDYRGWKKSDLLVHVAAMHREQRMFLCKICGKKYKWRSSLSYHRKHHDKY